MLTMNPTPTLKLFCRHDKSHNYCKKINSTEITIIDKEISKFNEISTFKEILVIHSNTNNPNYLLSKKMIRLNQWSDIAKVVLITSIPLNLYFAHPVTASITLAATSVLIHNYFKEKSIFNEMDVNTKKRMEAFRQSIKNLVDEINRS